eukprot:gene14058-biopygen9136
MMPWTRKYPDQTSSRKKFRVSTCGIRPYDWMLFHVFCNAPSTYSQTPRKRNAQRKWRTQPCGQYLVSGRTPCKHCGAPLWQEEQRLDRKRAAGELDSEDEDSADVPGAAPRKRRKTEEPKMSGFCCGQGRFVAPPLDDVPGRKGAS